MNLILTCVADGNIPRAHISASPYGANFQLNVSSAGMKRMEECHE
jgi:hypothetical protein